MLILSRKKGQKLIINDNIEIVVMESEGGVVKIGINAPKDISIYREEVYVELKKANKDSSSAELDAIDKISQSIVKPAQNSKLQGFSVKIVKNEKK